MSTSETFYFIAGMFSGLFLKSVIRYIMDVAIHIEQRLEHRRRERLNGPVRSMNYIRANVKRAL